MLTLDKGATLCEMALLVEEDDGSISLGNELDELSIEKCTRSKKIKVKEGANEGGKTGHFIVRSQCVGQFLWEE